MTLLKVELKTTKDTTDVGTLQKAADFVHAFVLGAVICLQHHEGSKHCLHFDQASEQSILGVGKTPVVCCCRL